MPPKARITREMIIDAGLAIVRECGIDQLNARTVSERLGCSTQPVMYHFKRIEDMRRAVYHSADELHSAYLAAADGDNPMLAIGLAYIRFAHTEKHLFQLLFQTNEFSGRSIVDLISAEELAPMLGLLSQAAGVGMDQARGIFKSLFLFVHGYASMLANNALDYDEAKIIHDLERIFMGAMYASREEEK